MTSPIKKSKSLPSSPSQKRKPGSKRTATERKPRREVALAEVKDDLSRYLRLAENQEIIITRHGKPAGVLIGFESEDDWFEYRLEHDPRFLRRVSEARAAIAGGHGIPLEAV
ncbi:MAG: type II toxin-antitoxin system Phd/YefM family antitoxin [Gemmatimonadaceae bacterium]|nr:type II toxin-antitoxin system Phd/YefM family antitoxin [Gemmatimonadaceae bacterium]